MTDLTVVELDIPRLRHLIGKLSRRLRTIDAESGLTPTQSSVLGTVVRFGGSSTSRTAVRLRSSRHRRASASSAACATRAVTFCEARSTFSTPPTASALPRSSPCSSCSSTG
jgi:hypothetical protein